MFGVFEREGRVYTEIVTDCKRLTLQAVILDKVSIESVIYSDGWVGCWVSRHFRVCHGDNEFARDGHNHINGIESFWSFTKQAACQVQWGISKLRTPFESIRVALEKTT